jgi:Transposase DDE domain
VTSASLHDSQAAIPVATLTAQRVVNLYDLLDSAYDAPEIHRHSRSLHHVPIIDINVRRDAGRKQEQTARQTLRQRFRFAEAIRYTERTAAERANGRLKDNLGARTVRVRGPLKVMCHLMFGVLALTVDQLVRLVT